MRKRYPFLAKSWLCCSLFAAFVFLFSKNMHAQTAPPKQWDKSIGGLGGSALTSLQQTSDGGYILGGSSYAGVSGDKSQPSQGNWDYWIVKVDASGNKTWDKTFGGNDEDYLTILQQTSDGGYILGGYSKSGISGDKSQASKGYIDYWVVKVSAIGIKMWDKTFGGNNSQQLRSLQQTSDGGYILGGYSVSGISGDKTQASKGGSDYWVVKLDANGNKLWDKAFGGSASDNLQSLQQTSDGGYILGGESASGISGDKTQASKGDFDYWVVKLDANGNKTWDKTFGGNLAEVFSSLQQTSDGGYILGGSSLSGIGGDKSQLLHGPGGYKDYWVVKLDAIGNKLWDKAFGGDNFELLRCLQQTSDGGYILGGESRSSIGGDVSEVNRGGVYSPDYWIVKLDASGNKTWDKTVGGSAFDEFFSLDQTSDGGYILGGTSQSNISGDKSQPTHCCLDYWIVKLAPPAPSSSIDVAVTAITSFNSGCNLTNQETISIIVENLGGTSQSNIPVSYKINNGTLVDELVAGPVVPNGLINYTFTTKANLSALGSYTIEARTKHPSDATPGNDAFTKNITVSSIPNAPIVTVEGEVCNESVSLLAIGAPSGGSYLWYTVPTAGTPLHSSPSGILKVPNLTTTTFYVAIKDASGCEGSRTSITVKPCPDTSISIINIPNIITPNSDNKNDIFKPQNLPAGKWHLQVYNRWGLKLFEASDYQNNWPDKKISDGTYYYLLRNSDTGEQFKGWVEVIQ